jgi:hypothetical protein
MQAHGGTIRGKTRDSGGASFILTLPRGEPPSDDGGTSDAVEMLAESGSGEATGNERDQV